jgi:hypothetical protein
MYCIYKIIIIITVIIIICILSSRLNLFCAYCYINDKYYIHFGGSLEYWVLWKNILQAWNMDYKLSTWGEVGAKGKVLTIQM